MDDIQHEIKRAPIFDTQGDLNLVEMSNILGFEGKLDVIALNFGVAQSSCPVSISHYQAAMLGTECASKLGSLIYMTNMLWDYFDGDRSEIVDFMQTPREAWSGLTPTNLMSLGKHIGIVNFLERILFGEVLGS